MQPDSNKNATLKIAAKEFGQFFRAPIAWIFLSVFLVISFFIVFWVEAFFARNIADVRPLFEWMPILLIFLSSALTMKMWSEERRSGTLEHVITQPVPLWQFVLGKFFACWGLLAIGLLLTLPLPITVSFLGDLDWGPVLSGYIAALMLGGAYLAMGLFVSARCDNQIVSLILSALLMVVFYLIGSGVATGLVNTATAELLRSLGTGARFESITRGVLDFRDLYFYISLMAGFLALNIFALEAGRWAKDGNGQHHRVWRWGTGLLVANALVANVWLGQVNALRWDTTQGSIYSISDSTKSYLGQLQEPLLIRGYFSQKTHPLLSPLVPQMQDLLREYEIAGKGRVNVEIVDPTSDPELEDEANKNYSIRPTPFRVNDRHQASLVNSYFDILIKYGNEYQVLSFNDLIEVKAESESELNVQLRNPEYDVTRIIKKVLFAYQSGGDVFDAVSEPISMTAYISDSSKLPSELAELSKAIRTEAQTFKDQAGGKFDFKFVDPDANGGAEGKRITEEYGFAPMAAGLMDPNRFYFYVTLAQGDMLMQVPMDDFTEASFKKGIEAGIKRFSKGFTRTVALVVPEQLDRHMAMQMGVPPDGKARFDGLNQLLAEDMNVVSEDLKDGMVDLNADILMIAAPELKTDQERFAVDQFLMRGGTVILAASPFSALMSRDNLAVNNYATGLETWLEHLGISFEEQLVMDKQSAAFPIPTVREVGGMRFQEMRMLDYPYFIDVRGDGMNRESLITADLPQVTVPWASPIILDNEKLAGIQITPLLNSTDESWLADNSGVMPDMATLSRGFPVGSDQKSHLLAVALEGKFTSQFAGKDSPLLEQEAAAPAEGEEAAEQTPAINMVLNHSAESARIILFGSNDLFRDEIVGMLGAAQGGAYLNSLQMAVNTVDWALEDQSLAGIRARGHFNRTLIPMEQGEQEFWEYLNYGLALAGLLALWFAFFYQSRSRNSRYQQLLAA